MKLSICPATGKIRILRSELAGRPLTILDSFLFDWTIAAVKSLNRFNPVQSGPL